MMVLLFEYIKSVCLNKDGEFQAFIILYLLLLSNKNYRVECIDCVTTGNSLEGCFTKALTQNIKLRNTFEF